MRMQYKHIFGWCLVLLPCLSHAQYAKEDWKDRDQWMDVPKLLEWAEVGRGDIVADIGCHEGYLTFHLSEVVGNYGVVYAVDVNETPLRALRTHLKEEKVENVQVVLGDYDDPKLPENLLNHIFIIDAYHEMVSYQDILTHCFKALKPGGKLIILEKLKFEHRNKDRAGQTAAHTLASSFVREELETSGFQVVHYEKDFGPWERNPEKVMWVLIAQRD